MKRCLTALGLALGLLTTVSSISMAHEGQRWAGPHRDRDFRPQRWEEARERHTSRVTFFNLGIGFPGGGGLIVQQNSPCWNSWGPGFSFCNPGWRRELEEERWERWQARDRWEAWRAWRARDDWRESNQWRDRNDWQDQRWGDRDDWGDHGGWGNRSGWQNRDGWGFHDGWQDHRMDWRRHRHW